MVLNKQRIALMLHPIRHRMIGVLSGRQLTAEQISQLLDDIPPATLYRHINVLLEGGLIEVVGEQRQQGRTTRILALTEGAGSLTRNQLNPNAADDNTQAVNLFLTGLMTTYSSALRDPSVTPGDWRLTGYHMYLSPKEELELAGKVHALLVAACEQPPAAGRRRRLLSFGALPDRDLPPEDQDETTP
jgi:DNA-binding transcriptional ArsR family regulator